MKTVAVLLLLAPVAVAQQRVDTGLVIDVHATLAAGPDAPGFFHTYQSTLGGTRNAFPTMGGGGADLVLQVPGAFLPVLTAEALSLAMDDAGMLTEWDAASNTERVTLRSVEQWTAQTYPLLLGVRYAPVASRYQSFLTLAAGVAISHLWWSYTADGPYDASRFPAGAAFERTAIVPTLALGAGVELLFDQFHQRELLRGLFVEARYRWARTPMSLLAPLASRVSAPAAHWNDAFPVAFDGFEAMLGVTFQFAR